MIVSPGWKGMSLPSSLKVGIWVGIPGLGFSAQARGVSIRVDHRVDGDVAFHRVCCTQTHVKVVAKRLAKQLHLRRLTLLDVLRRGGARHGPLIAAEELDLDGAGAPDLGARAEMAIAVAV